jgi:exportin-7
MLTELLTTLFNILIYGESNNQWSLSRPMLSLTLASEEAFKTYQQQISSTQSPENQARLGEAFAALLVDMQRNLEPSNRDRFTQKITTFRHTVRTFLTSN